MSETKMYSVLDKWTDLNTENIVDFTSVDGVVTEARVNGVPTGGEVVTRTITNTLANPFADEGPAIWGKMQEHKTFADLTMDATALGFGTVTMPLMSTANEQLPFHVTGANVSVGDTNEWTAFAFAWQPSVIYLAYALIAGQTQDLLALASQIPTTLTLYEVE